MIEDKIARVKKLIAEREKIDGELASLFGGGEQPRRGRPPKDQAPRVAQAENSPKTDSQITVLPSV